MGKNFHTVERSQQIRLGRFTSDTQKESTIIINASRERDNNTGYYKILCWRWCRG